MGSHELLEIEAPGCYSGKTERFNAWRCALADMTGVSLQYVLVEKPVSLTSGGDVPAPTRLPFVEAVLQSKTSDVTSRERLGRWDMMPDDPLLALLLLTVPGGTIRHDFAGPMAARLREMRELMYALDDGRYGLLDLGRFTEAMEAGLRRIGAEGVDVDVRGGYEPSGWWSLAGALAD